MTMSVAFIIGLILTMLNPNADPGMIKDTFSITNCLLAFGTISICNRLNDIKDEIKKINQRQKLDIGRRMMGDD